MNPEQMAAYQGAHLRQQAFSLADKRALADVAADGLLAVAEQLPLAPSFV